MAYLNSPHREAPKNATQKIEKKSVFGFFIDFFATTFRRLKRLLRVFFELPSLRNTRKRDKTKKKVEGKPAPGLLSLLRAFDMGFLQYHLCGVLNKRIFLAYFFYSRRWKLPENAMKQKKSRGRTDMEFFVDFLLKVFDMGCCERARKHVEVAGSVKRVV
jgi:hypothetical protein